MTPPHFSTDFYKGSVILFKQFQQVVTKPLRIRASSHVSDCFNHCVASALLTYWLTLPFRFSKFPLPSPLVARVDSRRHPANSVRHTVAMTVHSATAFWKIVTTPEPPELGQGPRPGVVEANFLEGRPSFTQFVNRNDPFPAIHAT